METSPPDIKNESCCPSTRITLTSLIFLLWQSKHGGVVPHLRDVSCWTSKGNPRSSEPSIIARKTPSGKNRVSKGLQSKCHGASLWILPTSQQRDTMVVFVTAAGILVTATILILVTSYDFCHSAVK